MKAMLGKTVEYFSDDIGLLYPLLTIKVLVLYGSKRGALCADC